MSATPLPAGFRFSGTRGEELAVRAVCDDHATQAIGKFLCQLLLVDRFCRDFIYLKLDVLNCNSLVINMELSIVHICC